MKWLGENTWSIMFGYLYVCHLLVSRSTCQLVELRQNVMLGLTYMKF